MHPDETSRPEAGNAQHASSATSDESVELRRTAVAHASTLAELVTAHGSPAAFLDSPYGAAYLADRLDTRGWSSGRVASELGLSD